MPFYPELQDMILIRGDDPHPWLAKVVSIQDRAQTVRVLYYEKDPTRPRQDLFLPNDTRGLLMTMYLGIQSLVWL